ncbi:MAG: hypothetical protein DRG11_00750 [Epsilonproteobacteria bacterium]|nr:MAG: hypothetical protein DRG11_00750 [Campylobacterota bacterium]
MTDEQKRFIELYSFEKKTYPEIEKSMNINRKQLSALRDKEVNNQVANIQKIHAKFTKKRQKEFDYDFKRFYNWYVGQKQECGYCGITQQELYRLFDKDPNKRILPYLEKDRIYTKAPKRSFGTLEIERLDSSSNYTEKNLILACPLCNNAKSNLIDEKSWKELFVPVMQTYYKSLLN